ncbi:hypothetical protein [Microbacterium sp. SORGH_AS_0428]|uniref:hypothetical protein n=1 Tax=Microbacterium sp. SORGH_AS_0428 TaxID=3041788 RepID=UPI00286A04DE|nr:hypothetical protein [Microbacterium sp. SORGH_AS_0428]
MQHGAAGAGVWVPLRWRDVDVLDVGTGESITLSALAAELGHNEHRLGMRIYHYVRQRYPEHRPGDPWLLTPEQADDVRRNVR